MADYAPEVRRILQAAGWRYDRAGRGDHEVWINPATAKHVTIDAKILSRHTANGILKQAGLPKQF